MSINCLTALVLLLGFQIPRVWLVNNSCRKCLTNGAFCLDGKRYYRCNGNGILPDTSIIYECAENEVCSMQGAICVDRLEVVEANIACSENLGCDKCPETYEWPTALTCVSPTAYRMCQPGTQIGSSSIECPTGSLCSEEAYQHTGRICLPANVIQELEYEVSCDKPEAANYLPTSQDLVNYCEKFSAAKNIECFNMHNVYDSQCKSFIKCQRVRGVLKANLENCADGYYYDQNTNECVKTKPRGCGDLKMNF